MALSSVDTRPLTTVFQGQDNSLRQCIFGMSSSTPSHRRNHREPPCYKSMNVVEARHFFISAHLHSPAHHRPASEPGDVPAHPASPIRQSVPTKCRPMRSDPKPPTRARRSLSQSAAWVSSMRPYTIPAAFVCPTDHAPRSLPSPGRRRLRVELLEDAGREAHRADSQGAGVALQHRRAPTREPGAARVVQCSRRLLSRWPPRGLRPDLLQHHAGGGAVAGSAAAEDA